VHLLARDGADPREDFSRLARALGL
jgi:hypothetical protein